MNVTVWLTVMISRWREYSMDIIWCKDCLMELELQEEEDDGFETEVFVCPDCGGELTDEPFDGGTK
jgi:hypothetical protein